MYPKTLSEAYTPIEVKPLSYKKNYYGIRGLPTSHFAWIVLKWMPVNKVFRVTRTPPLLGRVDKKFLMDTANWHKDWDCTTLEEAVDVIRQLAESPLFQPTI